MLITMMIKITDKILVLVQGYWGIHDTPAPVPVKVGRPKNK